MSSKISATGASVKGFGMQVNDDGTASYFAVLKKSSAAQKQRIEKNAEKKKEAKKAEAKSEPEKKETAAAAPAADLTDDTELVAVISAAIAASEGTTTEGFVVRSINRR